MVPECWCVVSGQVEVGLESIAPVGIEVLCVLNLVGTLMVWSLLNTISYVSFIYCCNIPKYTLAVFGLV